MGDFHSRHRKQPSKDATTVSNTQPAETASFRLLEPCEAEVIKSEITLLKSFAHRNIVRVTEVRLLNECTLSVLDEQLEDKLLPEHHQNQRTNAKLIMRDITEGLHYLHTEKRYVHERLSHCSILFRKGGAALRIISKLVVSTQGTQYYLAPQLQQGIYGYFTDIFALGVLFLEILQGRTIQEEVQDYEHMENKLQTIDDPDLRNLITRMMSTQFESRPNTEEILKKLGYPPIIQVATPQQTVSKLMTKTREYWSLKLSEETLDCLLIKNKPVIESEASQGNATAMFLLGRIYQGEDVGTPKQAEQLFLKAVAANFYEAYFNLFLAHMRDDIGKDYLQRGAELNDTRCVWEYARCVGFGFRGYTIDIDKALKLMASLPIEFPDRAYNIIRLNLKLGGTQNFPAQSQEGLSKGAALGHRKAIEALGDCIFGQRKYKEAMKYYLAAWKTKGDCIQNESELMHSCGSCMDDLRDKLASAYWLNKAHKSGSRIAKRNLVALKIF